MIKGGRKWRDICYSFGNFSGGIVSYAMGSWYMYYYMDELGLPARYYSYAMLIYGIWNAINDPMMGIISDNTRSRWGRRKPYMMFGAIPLGLALVMLFVPPQTVVSQELSLFIYFVAALCLFDTFFTMTMLAWSAVLPEMYLDEGNRARVNVYSQILGVLGAMAATLGVQPIINALGYGAMALIFAVIGIITMLMSAWGVRENRAQMEKKSLSVWESFKATFSSKAFVICVLSVLLVEIGKVFCTSTMPFYSEYVMENDLGVTIIMGAMFVSSMIFAPVVSLLCNRVGAKMTYIITTAVFALACVGYMFAPNIVVAAVLSAVVGFGVSGIMIMPNMLYAEIIDEDQLKTGVRREGAFYGMNALVMRLSVIVHGSVSALVLERSGYLNTLEVQPDSVVWGIRALMGGLPVIFIVLAIIVLIFYPIDKNRLAEVQQRVREMNEQARP
jgi:GPH family glycoside/pentoside/hexuronide:cation symporter